MDTLSHALWGYVALRWRGPRSARWGALLGTTPDLLYGAARFTERIATVGWRGLADIIIPRGDPTMWYRDGPPLPEALLTAYHRYYVWSHSLVVLAAVALVWYECRRRPPWLLLPWLLHILMDLPSHERFLTPVFYPLWDWTLEGYAWSRPPLLIANVCGLLAAHGLLYARYRRPGRPARAAPWPEEVSGVA